ncbi:MAG: hypothetical protein WC683_09345 [bacterium]|jgi:predicted transcriptional regulator
MVTSSRGRALLTAYLQEHRLRKVAVARAIGTSHVAVLYYLTGAKRPDASRRAAIERWTGGAVPAESWLTEEEQAALAAVQPREKTGTDA